MADAEKQTLTLQKPAGPVTSAAGKARWNVTDGKHRFVIFDEDLVKAFEKAELAGVEREYLIEPAKEQGLSPVVVGIPGVYERKRKGGSGGGGYGGGKPLLTDRQAALFAALFAVQVGIEGGSIAQRTEEYVKLLAGPGSGRAAAATQKPPAAAAAQPARQPKPEPKPDPKPEAKRHTDPDGPLEAPQQREIERLVTETGYDLLGFLDSKELARVEDLTAAQADKLIVFLRGRLDPAKLAPDA